LTLSLLIVLASCASGPSRPARISHIVFCKLHDPSDAGALIADCDARLADIPGVAAYARGTHLDTGRGERVDGDYDVGLYLGFESEEAYEGYLNHPQHVTLVEDWRTRWQWIRVYDVLDESP
jgi:hypothetical protein